MFRFLGKNRSTRRARAASAHGRPPLNPAVAGSAAGTVGRTLHDGDQCRFGGKWSLWDAGALKPSISADGRYVVFYSEDTNLVSGDTNVFSDIFLKDTLSGSVTRLSIDANGASE